MCSSDLKELGESEQALLPIENESLEVVETSETLYSEDIRITSNFAEGEAVEAFDAETNGALIEEPIEQA